MHCRDLSFFVFFIPALRWPCPWHQVFMFLDKADAEECLREMIQTNPSAKDAQITAISFDRALKVCVCGGAAEHQGAALGMTTRKHFKTGLIFPSILTRNYGLPAVYAASAANWKQGVSTSAPRRRREGCHDVVSPPTKTHVTCCRISTTRQSAGAWWLSSNFWHVLTFTFV